MLCTVVYPDVCIWLNPQNVGIDVPILSGVYKDRSASDLETIQDRNDRAKPLFGKGLQGIHAGKDVIAGGNIWSHAVQDRPFQTGSD